MLYLRDINLTFLVMYTYIFTINIHINLDENRDLKTI